MAKKKAARKRYNFGDLFERPRDVRGEPVHISAQLKRLRENPAPPELVHSGAPGSRGWRPWLPTAAPPGLIR